MSANAAPITTDLAVKWIPLDHIHEAAWNPRKHFDAKKLGEMADSIRQKGVLEPAIVRLRPQAGGYELVAGARRFRATKLAGLSSLPAIVRDLDDTSALEFAVIENGQREDVSPVEEAEGFQALQAMDAERFTVAEIAAKVGKAESYVYRRLKLLTLEQDYREALADGRLTIAHAETLCRLTPKDRALARERSLIWIESPLFDGDEDDIPPTADNLAPLHELQRFVRMQTHFDPTTEDTRHFQPELVQDLADVVDGVVTVPTSVIELSDDPMVRSRIGVGPNDPAPLSPSKWREITTAKDRCAFVQRGVVTHGGPARVLNVCVNKKCAKHFEQPKPAAAPSKAGNSGAKTTPAKPAGKPKWQIEEEKREVARQEWEALKPHARKALVEYLKTQKLDLRVVLEMLIDGDLLDDYGVKLTKDTLPLCAALAVIGDRHWSRQNFLEAVKPFKFNLGPVEQKFRNEQKKATTAATKKGKA